MDTSNQQTVPTVDIASPSEVRPYKASTWVVPMLVGGAVGVVASFPLTAALIEGDPSSTAALAYIFTIPFGLFAGMVLGVMSRWCAGRIGAFGLR